MKLSNQKAFEKVFIFELKKQRDVYYATTDDTISRKRIKVGRFTLDAIAVYVGDKLTEFYRRTQEYYINILKY